MDIKAYAKVNLILKVVGKMDNGYHALQMFNSKIDLFDEIKIEINNKEKDNVYFLNSTIDETLVLKVLKEVKEKYNICDNFDIYIKKNIPLGAGLGGGSCDVASIINAICDMYHITYDLEEMINLVKEYGADIPYALINNQAIVEGIGEKINITDYQYTDSFVIVNPNIFISTPIIFKNNKVISNKKAALDLVYEVQNKGYLAFSNDLEESALDFSKELKEVYNKLSKIGYTVMSGSGSTMMVFGEDIDYIYNECKKIDSNYLVKKVNIIKE